MRTTPTLIAVLVLGSGLALAVQEEAAPVSYAADVEPLFLAACGDCHGARRPKKGLDLSAGKGHASLVNRPSNELPEQALVTPGDPDASYLWHKLTHTAAKGRGMPRTLFSAKKLPADQLELVRRWIAEGARP